MQYSLYQLKDIFNKHNGDMEAIQKETGYHMKHLRRKKLLLSRKFDDFYYTEPTKEDREQTYLFASHEQRLEHLDNPERFTLIKHRLDNESEEDICDPYGFDYIPEAIRWT